MSNSPRSPLHPTIQLAISATNVPFHFLNHLFSPTTRFIQSTCTLIHRLTKQNYIFLCIFLLHLWDLFKASPPIRPLAQHWKRIATGLLFACCSTPASLILHASIPPFRAYWVDQSPKTRTEAAQRLALFVFTCAPACAILGATVTAAGFVWKQHRYGKYRASMRKLGRGYWADPRDFEDWRRAGSSREVAERLRAWEGVKMESFVVERVCERCKGVKEGLNARCAACGAYEERVDRREW